MAKRQKNNQPVHKGAARVPVVMQMEALECGAACLAMVLAYYGRWVPLEKMRLDCGVSRDGSNALNILHAAENYGLEAKGYKLEPELLKRDGYFPCIIHWNFNHFVVLCGFVGNKAVINDPGRGIVRVPMADFDASFTGVCILFQPTDSFTRGGSPQRISSFARERLKGTGTAIAFVVLTTLITALVGIINPAFSRVFMDRLLTEASVA